jgi:hypothetical protein
MDSDSKRGELEPQGVTGYDVVANQFLRGPVVEVTGRGPNSEAAIRSTEVVLTEAEAVLAELQRAAGADPEYFINSAPLDPPSTATAMYGSTMRAGIGALAVGAVGTIGLAVLAEAIARRRTVQSIAATGPDISNTASPGTDGGTSNGSRTADWSAILPALRSAREMQSTQESARPKTAQEEPLQHEPSMEKSTSQESALTEPSRPDPRWQKTIQPEPSSEFPADNGHKRPTTDRSP